MKKNLEGIDLGELHAHMYFEGDESGEIRAAMLPLLSSPRTSLYDSVERRIVLMVPETFEGLALTVKGEGIDVGMVCAVGQSSVHLTFPKEMRGTPVVVTASYRGVDRRWDLTLNY